jgi:hypothetical protein
MPVQDLDSKRIVNACGGRSSQTRPVAALQAHKKQAIACFCLNHQQRDFSAGLP